MKTAMQELIEKIKEAQKSIISNTEYAKGYDGALSDCIDIINDFYLEKEKQ